MSLETFRFHGIAVPQHMHEGIRAWIDHAVPPGNFLYAVITNDLKEACTRADHINLFALPAIVAYFWAEAPAACWGSEEAYDHWREFHRSAPEAAANA